MTGKSTNVLCLLLAVAGLSFGVGQTVGQSADAANPNARIIKRLDRTSERVRQANLKLDLIRRDLGDFDSGLHGDVKDLQRQTFTIHEQVRQVCGAVRSGCQ